MTKPRMCIIAATLGLSSVACSDEVGTILEPGSDELWLLQTRVFNDDGTMGYAIATATLDGTITNERSIEQGGGGMVYATPGAANGSFLLSYAERATLTRFEVSETNEIIEGDTLSFANYGVQSGYGTIAWVDEHTAYWLDSGELQLIRFDPTEMSITGAVSIEGIEREGFVTELGNYPVVREDGVFVTVRWRKDWEDPQPTAPSGAMLVHVDPATDEVTVTEDERCTSLLLSKQTASGDTYWFSDNYNTYARIIGGDERGVPDCSLRVRAGEKTFDPDWYLDLNERTGGRPADGVIAGDGSIVWLSVFHAEELEEQPGDIDTADVAPAWQWYAVDVESDTPAVENTQRPFTSHGAFGWYAAGRSFSSSVNEDYSVSTLLEVTADGFQQRAAIQGLLDAIVKVR